MPATLCKEVEAELNESSNAAEPGREGLPTISTSDQTRKALATGQSVELMHELRTQLQQLRGLRVSQFAFSNDGMRMSFWPQEGTVTTVEVFVQEETIGLGRAGTPAAEVDATGEFAAATLVKSLNCQLDDINVKDGKLRVLFDNGLELTAAPNAHWESWQIAGDDGLLIVCLPGGGLSFWPSEKTKRPNPPADQEVSRRTGGDSAR